MRLFSSVFESSAITIKILAKKIISISSNAWPYYDGWKFAIKKLKLSLQYSEFNSAEKKNLLQKLEKQNINIKFYRKYIPH